MATILEFRQIPLGDLSIGTWQVRTRDVGKEIDQLVESIRKVGQLEPIVVAEADEPGKYEIITGQRRFLAHQELGKETIWAAVLDERIREQDAKVLSITENLVRRDLNQRDLIDACTYLYHQYGSLKAVAEETGLPYGKVAELVKYVQLAPELKKLVDDREVSMQTALRAQQAASVRDGLNAEEAVQFAKDMTGMSGAQQQQVVKKRRESPLLPADTVIEDAKAGGRVTQVVVTLTSEVHGALSDYAQSHDTNVDDAAGMLIRDGLYVNDFLADR